MLNMIRSTLAKNSRKYGSPVLFCDGRYSWRKNEFTPYKAHRKADREELTHIDWQAAFALYDSFKEEVVKYTPWPLICVDGAEGDDGIAQMVIAIPEEQFLIVSRDHDFVQLQAYCHNCAIWDPESEKAVVEENPYKYLQEHIFRGDKGDGIPNVLSDDDTFITGRRQKRLLQTKLEELMHSNPESWDPKIKAKYDRNIKLIDLRKCPEDIKEKILIQYRDQINRCNNRKFFDYFVKYKLVDLLDKLQDFK